MIKTNKMKNEKVKGGCEEEDIDGGGEKENSEEG
jgi:hypothetical protein